MSKPPVSAGASVGQVFHPDRVSVGQVGKPGPLSVRFSNLTYGAADSALIPGARLLVFLGILVALVAVLPTHRESQAKPLAPQRSPVDLVVLPGGQFVLTANHTSDSVTLVDLKEGKVLAEVGCGRKPSAIACSRDGQRAAVSNLWSGTVTLLDVTAGGVKIAGNVAVGPMPRGLVFAADGASFYVAVAEEVVRIDWLARKVQQRWSAPREPHQLALSTDGRWLAAASSRSGQVRCWDTRNGKLYWERVIEDGFNLRGLAFSPDARWLVCAHLVRRAFPVSKENIQEGWVIDSRLTRLPLQPDAQPPLQQVALDTRGRAVGDPHGLAFSADGRQLLLAAGGTHELLTFDVAAIPWNSGDPGDFIDAAFREDDRKFRRLPLGGRPLAVAVVEKSERLVVANYLADALQVVDVRAGKVVRTIPLGAPAQASLARQGEALFYDAQRSRNQWFSCHSCHVEGHTCGLNFDTLNDDSYGNPKLTPTLRNVTHTGPWTWHGWQKDLAASVDKSMTQTMYGPKPTPMELRALLAFLETLDHPPNPHLGPGGTLGAAAQRGKALFHGKAGCVRCHKGENYTSESNYDVKLEADGSPYRLWNPPSLRGVWDRGPFLHDGRARSLEELLQEHHTPERLGTEALSGAERRDLIAFLQTL